jgi:hypothetical protein
MVAKALPRALTGSANRLMDEHVKLKVMSRSHAFNPRLLPQALHRISELTTASIQAPVPAHQAISTLTRPNPSTQ